MELIDHEIRYTTMDDLPYLQKWLEDPGTLKYYPMSLGAELEMSVKNWIGFSRHKCSLTAIIGKEAVGIATLYLMPYRKVCHHSLFYMAVNKEYRRKGIGTSLLKNLLNLAQKHFFLESVHAEVFSGSPIISLLEKQDFTKIATQENYVKIDEKYLSRILYEHVF